MPYIFKTKLVNGGENLEITGGTNTFNITNGTASLDVAAGKVVDIDANLTVGAATNLDEAISMSAKATQTAWTDYFASSTIAGWAASPTGKIMYKKIGSMVFVKFYITGTSDAITASFTVPYTVNNDFTTYLPSGYNSDNSIASATPACIRVNANSTTIQLYKDLTIARLWTALGTKAVYGEFFYETT